MPDLIAASTWVVLACVVLSFSMFSPLPFASKRLIWLVCSIPQYVALQDGPYHAILSTTSSMALRAQAMNGFESMYRVRGNQSPNPPWDRLRMTQQPSTTHGSIVTGSAEDINGSAIRAPTLHVQFSLRDHQTSCTLGCPLRRHPRTRMVADVRPRLSMIFNLIGASDFDT